MIRVLEVLATLGRAGVERMVQSLVCRLDRREFEPAVATLYDAAPEDLTSDVESCGVRLWRLGKRKGLDLRMYPRLRSVIHEFRPHIVHTHSYVMRYVLPVIQGPAVHTVHNLAEREVDRLGVWVHRLAFRRGVLSVAVASAVARSFERVYGFPPARTIPNGIDIGAFAQRQSSWRRTYGFKTQDVLIVSAARLEPQKNPLLLAEAFQTLPPNCHLLLAGDGSLRRELENRDRVHVLGVRRDLPDILASCDIFAMASNWEGHPIALTEALAAGLPVVATDVGGVSEIVRDAGLLISPGDLRGLRSALLRLAEDSAMRAELSRRALQYAPEFDVSHMVQSYADLFRQMTR